MCAGAPKTHVSASLPDRLHAVLANNAKNACERLRGASLTYVIGVAGRVGGVPRVKTAFAELDRPIGTPKRPAQPPFAASFLKPSAPHGLQAQLARGSRPPTDRANGLTTLDG